MNTKLTNKQKRFCEEYVVDFNGTQAAIRAGYKKHTAQQIASENLSKPLISDYIEELTKQIAATTAITAEYLDQKAIEVINKCSHPADYQPQPILKAVELLGKRIGYFELDNAQKNPISAGIEKLSLEALQTIAEKLNDITDDGSELDRQSDDSGSPRVTH